MCPGAHLILCLATIPSGGHLGRRDIAMTKRNPFSGRVDALPDHDFKLLHEAVRERACRSDIGVGTLAEAVAKYRPDPPCPKCGAPSRKDGRTPSDVQRHRCKDCGHRFVALAGTVLESCNKDLATWVDFVRLMCFNVPIEAAAEICRITHQTAWEWRHRVFATVNGYQDRIVLRDRVWIDETYITDTDLTHGYGQARKRGLSKQKLCIVVAIDVHKNIVAVVCGHGKPSSKRIKEGLQSHIAEGSTIVDDKERSHNALVKAVKGVRESYKADVRDPIYLECMEMVNNLCSWLKRYLWRFTGMDPDNLQSYLNWYVYLFRVNQAQEKWPRTARVVRHLVMSDAHYRSSSALRSTRILDC